MTRYGKCSVCQVVHPAPFGSRCRYVSDAKLYCKDNGIDEAEFMKHIDFAGMPKPVDQWTVTMWRARTELRWKGEPVQP